MRSELRRLISPVVSIRVDRVHRKVYTLDMATTKRETKLTPDQTARRIARLTCRLRRDGQAELAEAILKAAAKFLAK